MVFASTFSRDRRLLAGVAGSSSGTTGNEVGLVLTRSFVHELLLGLQGGQKHIHAFYIT